MTTDFSQIVFDPTRHTYTLDGENLRSVSSIVKSITPPFDVDHWAPIKAAQRGISEAEIRAEWEAAKMAGQERGTRLHRHVETILQAASVAPVPDSLPEAGAFERWWEGTRDTFRIHKTEWIVGDAELGVAGTLDAILVNPTTGRLYLWDWKTGKGFRSSNRFQRLLPPFGHLDDCEWHRYSIQVSLYRLIVERNTDIRFREANILYLTPDGSSATYNALDYRYELLAWLSQGGAS